MSDKNILSLQKKEQLAEAVRIKKVTGKDKKVFGENSRGKVIENQKQSSGGVV